MGRRYKKQCDCWMACLKQAYSEATPPLEFESFYKIAVSKQMRAQDGWFLNHYLPDERLLEIIKEQAAKFKLNGKEKDIVAFNVWNYGPTSKKD